jgi:hypothetical protein
MKVSHLFTKLTKNYDLIVPIKEWLVYEQVYIAALDCHNISIANDCLNVLKAQFPKSLRVKKLLAMKSEVTNR